MADAVQRRRGWRGSGRHQQKVYRCQFCAGYHIGTPIGETVSASRWRELRVRYAMEAGADFE